MLAIALIGFAVLALRMWALGLGLPSWLHPDEYRVLFFAQRLRRRSQSAFFTYLTFHCYLLALVYGAYFLWQNIFGQQRNYDLVIETSLSMLAIDPQQAVAHRLLTSVLKHQARGARR
jgi:hypothetical protein